MLHRFGLRGRPSRLRSSRVVALASMGLALLLTQAIDSPPAQAQEPGAAPRVMMGDGSGNTVAADAGALLGRARSLGSLPVIVQVDADFVPEGELAAPQLTRQQSGIASRQQAVLGRLASAQNVKRFETVPYLALTATPADLQQLLGDPAVVSIIEDVAVPPLLNQSTRVINANRAWQRGFRGNGWAVAVLDTGVQRGHDAFQGKIVSEACYSSTVAGQSTSVCRRGVASEVGNGAGRNCPAGVTGCDHGTHVAGIAVGNAQGRPGVARRGDLIPIQVFSRFDSAAFCGSLPAPCVLSYTSDQLQALERVLRLARNNKIAAVNMSLGGGQSFTNCDTNALKPVIDNLRSRGVATIIASGNNGFNGSISAPACISSAIAVGSTTKDDQVSSFSNHAALVSLMAPGSQISAPVLRNQIGSKSGTSMAAPHVAGAWAQIMQSRPNASVREVERALVCTGVDVARAGVTKPRIDVNRAINFLRSNFAS